MSFKGTKIYEGLRLKAYRCTAGFLTVGYGHNIDAHKDYQILDSNSEITLTKAEELYDFDMADVKRDVLGLFPDLDSYPTVVQDILCDLVFNMGIRTFRMFVYTIKMLRLKNYKGAADGLSKSKWYKQVGNRSKDIVETLRGI